ncbi:MAG: hypothetical protein Q4G59_02725, partial [Planctomycetia bacterium]|nr:hypothetical protein [Planctomycetia bacterium]
LAKAEPFDFTEDLDDLTLANSPGPQLQFIRGSNFFRGLALIDLAGAMLKRAFGENAVAVRVNAAGQGDYFQVHVDSRQADPEEVKRFIRSAIYTRFDLSPTPEFIEVHPGGPALGIRLNRFALIPQLIEKLYAGQ